MSIVYMNFDSYYLHGNHEISIILPDRPHNLLPKDFYGGDRKYKVIWLLHGAFGDHTDWLRKSKIELYARERDLCVVMPSAFNSGYANWDRFAMGTEDPGYLQFKNFKQYAESIKLKATFEEGPGKHDWRFWDVFIEKALQFFDTGDETR